MSEAKYTPGPWRYEHNSASDEKTFCMSVYPSLGEFGYRGDICYIQSTGHIDGGISTHESEQNARLIAAAPEQHEALIATQLLLERLGLESSDEYACNAAAIAKALGANQ